MTCYVKRLKLIFRKIVTLTVFIKVWLLRIMIVSVIEYECIN